MEIECTWAVKKLGESRTLLSVWTEGSLKEMRTRGFGSE